MGRRSILNKYQVLNAVDSTTNPESIETDISSVDYITYEFILDATVDADLSVQYCNDARITSASTFKDLNFGSTTPLDGSIDAGGIVHIKNMGLKWMKLVITNNGGTGNISAWVSGTVGGA